MPRLVLKRKPNESILLSKDDIDIAKITVHTDKNKTAEELQCKACGSIRNVTLAIEADKEISIMRTEKLTKKINKAITN